MNGDTPEAIFLGQSDEGPVMLRLDRANRHGLVAGATGTGKTVTLQSLAEAFARAGVPVFAADVKGDLSGIGAAAAPSEKLLARAAAMDLILTPQGAPVTFWDIYAKDGAPVRTTISEIGPVMLARLLELSDAQEGVISIAFRIADEQGLLLLDLDDLQAMLTHVAENAKDIGARYGNVAPATVSSIQRKLLTLRDQGAEHLFGEPALRLTDLIRTGLDGRGIVNILAASTLINSPRLYATFLLWLLSELFEQLPEVGDPQKPRLIFFFDEAHLLFDGAPSALIQKIEQVVRLIRSKGVGVWFVTQNPADIPESVLAQLGNRIQHALRAYTPHEQDALKLASRSYRPNPAFDTAEAIQALGVGEAVVSVLDEAGAPTVAARTKIRPPNSRIGPLTLDERRACMAASPVAGVYDTPVNRESAFEMLRARAEKSAAEAPAPAPRAQPAQPKPRAERAPSAPRRSTRQGYGETLAKSVIRTAGGQLGRALIRGLLGSLTRR